MEKHDIFISYRREGGKETAKHICDVLTGRGYRVFFDTDSLGSGDFPEALLQEIDNSKDFLIILSPNCLDRCRNESDWVRRELAYALKKEKNIIPVRMEGFSFPKELPEDINNVRYKNCISYDIAHFNSEISKLEKKYLKSKPWTRIRNAVLILLLVLAIIVLLLMTVIPRFGPHDSTPTPGVTNAVETTQTDGQNSIPVKTDVPAPTDASFPYTQKTKIPIPDSTATPTEIDFGPYTVESPVSFIIDTDVPSGDDYFGTK